MRQRYLPWMVAFVEGFSTLAVEVIAIRLAVPVVGSSIVLTGVMLGVVLLALSAGYWRGGALSSGWDAARTRKTLSRNLLLAAVLYGALAFPLEARLLERLLEWDFSLPLAIGVDAVVLLLLPIYLASQTVPMLAEITNIDGHAGRASGRVLFFSTLGSVAGGIVTPVWLFPAIGVIRTSYVVCALLAGAGAAMAFSWAFAGALALIAAVSAWAAPRNELFYFDSPYQTIRIEENRKDDGRVERVMVVGGGRASGIYSDTGETSFPYTRAVFAALKKCEADSLLVIGAAGFNLPRDAATVPRMRVIDAVDIDPAVRGISERHFLREALSPKIRFLPLSGRYAARKLHQEGRHYGFTLIDAYFGQGIPEELVTKEFFDDVRRISDRTVANMILDRDLESNFARSVLATFRAAFGAAWLLEVTPGDSYLANYLVGSWPLDGAKEWKGEGTVYRDDKNSAGRDHVAMKW